MTTHRVVAFSIALSLFVAFPSHGQESVIEFSDSFFDTSSATQSPWLLSGLGSTSVLPSCITLPSDEPELQLPSQNNTCAGSAASSSDGDGRSLEARSLIIVTPFRSVVGTVAIDAPYDPSLDGLLRGVRIRFKFLHGGSNSGTPVNALEIRALVLQRQADGSAKFYVSTGTARRKSRSNVTAYSTFDELLTEQDFGELLAPGFAFVDELSPPDFAGGGPVYFGFAVDLGWDQALGGPPTTPFTLRSFFVDAFSFELDSDFDGVPDFRDNCTLDPNVDQIDLDFDGFGDECDADCTQDGFTGVADFFQWSFCQRRPDCGCDLSGDGLNNSIDIIPMSLRWGRDVGPSGLVPQP